jgi:diguanylate cyclase (GGDEF)-like protein
MSIVVARRKRAALYLSICGLLIMVAAVTAVSTRDPSGVWLRIGIVMMTIGAAMWLPWQALPLAAVTLWLVPHGLRTTIDEVQLFDTNMLLELPGLIGLTGFAVLTRLSLRKLEEEDILLGALNDELAGMDPETGVYEERLLESALEAELVRSRRFGREFALVLVGVDELRQRFDYRDGVTWHAAMVATAGVLRSTRAHIDRVYRYGTTGFALLLPESGEREVRGLVRRLRRVAKQATPPEGEPGGPLATHFGATFFPHCATSVEDLLRRAEVAMRLAEKTPNRMQLDSAEAPDMPSPETLRQDADMAPSWTAEAQEAPHEEEPAVTAVVTLPDPVSRLGAPHLVLVENMNGEEVEDDRALAAAAGNAPPPARPVLQPEPRPVSLTLVSNHTAPFEADEIAGKPAAGLEAPPLDNAVSDLLRHLDETLDLIRSMKSDAAS